MSQQLGGSYDTVASPSHIPSPKLEGNIPASSSTEDLNAHTSVCAPPPTCDTTLKDIAL